VTENPICSKPKTHLTAHSIESLLVAVGAEDHRQRADGGFISTTRVGKAQSGHSRACQDPQPRNTAWWDADVLTESAEVGSKARPPTQPLWVAAPADTTETDTVALR